jgi:hypothetical protein
MSTKSIDYQAQPFRSPAWRGSPIDIYVAVIAWYDIFVAFDFPSIHSSRRHTRARNALRRNSLVDCHGDANSAAFVLLPGAAADDLAP